MKQNRLCYYGDLLYKNTEIAAPQKVDTEW